MQSWASIVLILLSTVTASADATPRFIVLEPPDGLPPPGVLVMDIVLDVDPTDVWLTATMNVTTRGENQLLYAPQEDPNQPVVVNPGRANAFVCSISAPLPRLGNERFDNGRAAVLGRDCPLSVTPLFSPIRLSVSWYDQFLAPCWERDSRSGAIARIAVSLEGNAECWGDLGCCYAVYDEGAVPPGAVPIVVGECPESHGYWGLGWGTCDQPTLPAHNWVLALTPHAANCRYDITGDQRIGIDDLSHVLTSFGGTASDGEFNPRVDFDRDGQIGLRDLVEFLSHWDAL